MEVRPGYKLTEVGVIPEEWDIRALYEGIDLLSGHHILAEQCNTKGKGTPYITGPANFPDGIIKNCKFTEKPSTICQQNDILVTVKGSGAGTIALSNGEYCISRQLMAIRVNKWDTTYVFEALYNDISFFEKAATGLIPGLSREDILNKQIILPPLLEQRRIAKALSDVDALINSLDQLITKKHDIKQATMQQLLTGKKRLPGFDGKWKIVRLEEVVKIIKGQLITEENTIAGIFPVIAGGKNPAYFHNKANRIGKTITISASGASAGYVAFFDEPIFASDCSTISESNTYSIKFVYYQLQLKQKAIYGMQSGGAQPHIHPDDIKAIEVYWPLLPEQNAIAITLSDLDSEITTLEQRRDKTKLLKQAMMQELLTGRIRLV